MRLTRFEWGCLGVILAAFVVRLTFLVEPAFIWDTAWYLMNSRAFLDTGSFLIRWSDPAAPIYSGYWPPLFPIFAAPFVAVFGPTYHAMVAAAIGAAALLVAAVFGMTRDLFGDRAKAFAAAAIIAASPAFYVTDAKGMSESLLGLAVALTVWAFVKSLERPIWLPVAGVFAFLAYLGKASLGLPLVAAGIFALAGWRIYTRGWRRVVTSPIDIGVAVAGLVGVAILAMTRTERIGGIGLGAIDPLRRVFGEADCGALVGQLTAAAEPPFHHVAPYCWALAFPLKVVFVSAFLFVVTLPLSLRLPQLLKAARTERTDALWLATILPILAGAVFTTTFFYTEHRPFVDFDNIRYLTPAVVPFVWLLLPLWSFAEEPAAIDGGARRRHELWYWSSIGALALLLLLNPLTGAETLGRFRALLALALVPLGLAVAAVATRYTVASRQVGRSTELRYVADRDARSPGVVVALLVVAALALSLGAIGDILLAAAPVLLLAAVALLVAAAVRRERALGMAAGAMLLGLAAWYYSAWYASVAIGLVVALSTTSISRRVVGFALILLVSAAPSFTTVLPTDEANVALATLPEGTIVGMTEIIVYPAAVAPDNVQVRLVPDPSVEVPPDVDALLVQTDHADREFPGFVRYDTWEYRAAFSPTLQARLWIEQNVLGEQYEYRPTPGLALFVREPSG